MALAWVLFAALAGSGCDERYAPLDETQIQSALDAQYGFQAAELGVLVRQIYEARLADPEKDLTLGRFCRGGADCVYSRVATAQLIREYWSAPDLAGAELHEQVVSDDDFTTHNLFLDLRGRTRPDEWVLASAHYDAWFGGANDNGTGVAALLAAARPLLRAGLDRSVRLILFDGEELGMVGAGRYVAEYGVAGVLLDLNADSIAFVGERGGLLSRQRPGVEYIVQANQPSAQFAFQLADLARRLPATTEMLPLVFPGGGVSFAGVAIGYDLSDHVQFWLANTPALFPFPAGDKPSWYHTADDTPAVVDDGRLQRVGRLWVAALAAFATVAP
jgi:hypothetical protein